MFSPNNGCMGARARVLVRMCLCVGVRVSIWTLTSTVKAACPRGSCSPAEVRWIILVNLSLWAVENVGVCWCLQLWEV